MPDCNGFPAFLALRQEERTCDAGVVALTTVDETEVLGHATDHEFDGSARKVEIRAICFLWRILSSDNFRFGDTKEQWGADLRLEIK